jgi:hypothetical protein
MGIHQLHLAQQAHAEPITERAADELRGVEEHSIDHSRGVPDPLQGERVGVVHELGRA